MSEENREKVLLSKKKYREENKEKIKESSKKYYEDNKEKIKRFEAIVLETFKKNFKEFEILDIGKGEVGTPSTFEKYTNRFEGRVGGIPHILDYYPFSYPKNTTPDPNIFLVGDTVFPGQGVVGVISGAFSLVYRILKNERS